MARGPVPTQTRVTFRALASFYILYLAYTLIKDFDQIPANQKVFFGIVIAVFTLVAGFFLFSCWKEWKAAKAAQAEEALAQQEIEAATVQEEPEEVDAERLALAERLAREGRVEELEELLAKAPEQEKAEE